MQTTFLKERKLIVDFTQTMYSLEFENTVNFHYLHHWMYAILQNLKEIYQRAKVFSFFTIDIKIPYSILSLVTRKGPFKFQKFLLESYIYPVSRFSHWFLPFFVCTLVTKIILKEIVAFVAILNKERKRVLLPVIAILRHYTNTFWVTESAHKQHNSWNMLI